MEHVQIVKCIFDKEISKNLTNREKRRIKDKIKNDVKGEYIRYYIFHGEFEEIKHSCQFFRDIQTYMLDVLAASFSVRNLDDIIYDIKGKSYRFCIGSEAVEDFDEYKYKFCMDILSLNIPVDIEFCDVKFINNQFLFQYSNIVWYKNNVQNKVTNNFNILSCYYKKIYLNFLI